MIRHETRGFLWSKSMKSIAIIGSGLSGLTVAHALKDKAAVTLFEKSRGYGGRMATRRADPFTFDHGAQFFSAKSDIFKSFLGPLIDTGIVKIWHARFAEIGPGAASSIRIWNEDSPHYVGTPQMNSIGKYLSKGLNIKLGTRVAAIQKKDQWQLTDEKNENLGSFDWIISTVPAQQALDILPSTISFYPDIAKIKMQACFSLMLGFEQPLPLVFDVAHVSGADISWVSENSSKPDRPDHYCLTIHSTNAWADKHLMSDRKDVLHHLFEQTSDVLGHDVSNAVHKDLHGWHFANIEKQFGPTYFLDPDAQIAACGDWCIQGRIESAFLSGHELASRLLELITMSGSKHA